MKTRLLGYGLTGVMMMAVVMGCGKKESQTAAPAPVGGVNPADVGRDMPVVAQPVPAQRDPAQVVAEVDGVKLTEGEIALQIERWKASMGSRIPPEQLPQVIEQARRQIMEQFVVKTLLTQAANKASITVDEKDIDEALTEIKGRLPEGLTFEEILKRENISLVDLRSNLVAEIRIKKLVESRTGKQVEPTEEEIKAFYESKKESFQQPESVHARHILIKNELNDDEAARAANKAKAEGIREKLVKGSDFAELARTESECPSSERGGDLGTFPRGQMVPAFEEAAFSQTTNAIGPVVETVFGCHIIQVLDRTSPSSQGLDQVREKIVTFLKRQKDQEGFWKYIEELKAKAKITLPEEEGMPLGGMMMPPQAQAEPVQETAPESAPEGAVPTAPVPVAEPVPAPEAVPVPAPAAVPAPVPGV
jgi:peptidyl-prolyl cis-trans isomerase C